MPGGVIIIIDPNKANNEETAEAVAVPRASYDDAHAVIDQAESDGAFVRIVSTA